MLFHKLWFFNNCFKRSIFRHLDFDLGTKFEDSLRHFFKLSKQKKTSEMIGNVTQLVPISFFHVEVEFSLNFLPKSERKWIDQSKFWAQKELRRKVLGDPVLGIDSKLRIYDSDVCARLENASTTPLYIFLNLLSKSQYMITVYGRFIS